MQRIAYIFLPVLLAVQLLGGCASQQKPSEGAVKMAQTPISDQPSGQTYPGRFVWHDLLTPDLLGAGKFYERLFGWQIEYWDEYAIIRNDGRLMAGILKVEPKDGRGKWAIWMPTVSVSDVDDGVRLARKHGGKVLKGPLDMEQRGRGALVRDPQGAHLVMLHARGGDPADSEPGMGDWLWVELWSKTPDDSASFYQSVLGYQGKELRDGYTVLSEQGKWRAGIRRVTRERVDTRWVPAVRVADPGAMITRVIELGGAVLVRPDQAPSNGDTALIADPSGGLLLIQRWEKAGKPGDN